ncbi:hypothetical protein [Streptomyces sp. NPDC005438]|uniref:hypothetical protein n=1 Tax=Streptomyces sp. NPDC005438 TaxID=3156880 RepID=UPI0033B8A67E
MSRTVRALAVLLVSWLVLVPVAGGASAAVARTPEPFTVKDPEIDESSGLAASRRHKDVYWTHNDSASCEGQPNCDKGPYVYAVDGTTGRTVAKVTMQGIDPRDMEAISLGPDGNLYVGDIGDNFDGRWQEVWIYRFPEPSTLRNTTVTPTRFTVRYDDGPRDAESLMVHPKTGRAYIASKNDEGKGGLYEGPEKLNSSGVNTFRRIAKVGLWATDGAFSPDGSRLILRSYFSAQMYRWKAGRPSAMGTVSVPVQPQGESVTFTPDGRTVMFGSERQASRVEPVELDERLLPESVPRKDRDRGNGGSSPDDDSPPGSSDSKVTWGLVALVGVALLALTRRKRGNE